MKYINLTYILSLFLFLVVGCSMKKDLTNVNIMNTKAHSTQDSLVIDGYFDSFSIKQGDSAVLYLNSKYKAVDVKLNIFDVNGKIVDNIFCDSIISQKANGDSISQNGYNFNYFIKFKISEFIKSGVYTISNKIPFLVKSKINSSKTIVVYPTNTIEAYNNKGGFSFYTVNNLNIHNASILSFHRPKQIDIYSEYFLKNYTDSLFDYISDIDLEDSNILNNYSLIVIIGHSEYWTRNARINFDQFVNKKGNALILSGNTMWWQVRYSKDNSQIICYKENLDPITDPKFRTINWNNKLLQYDILPSIGVDFVKGGYGRNPDKGWDGYKILSQNSPLLNETNLKYGDVISCSSIEYDGTFVIVDSNYKNVRLDLDKLSNFFKIELVGYDFGFRTVNTVGTFIVMQKNFNSGYIINTASTDWCSSFGLGGKDGQKIKKITNNCIDILTNNKSPFVH